MKKLLAAATALSGFLALTGAASAADPVIDTAYDWTGFYIGANVGYGGADIEGDFDLSDGPGNFLTGGSGSFNLDLNGIVGGAQAGYNWQTGNWVLGIEADASFVDWDDSVGPNIDTETVSAETDFLGTLRLRAGLAVDNWLLYATAGGAITDTKYTAQNGGGADRGSLNLNDIGVVVGGGVEWAFASNWSFRAEGLYFIFDDRENAATLTTDSDPGDNAELNDAWLARAGINFRF
ncbi:MAG: outer membrane protein [Methylococcales bacterium]